MSPEELETRDTTAESRRQWIERLRRAIPNGATLLALLMAIVVFLLASWLISSGARSSDVQTASTSPQNRECGLRDADRAAPRLHGGENAEKHAWPWLVAIEFAGNHFCGGSLVTEQWVITAGHCVATQNAEDPRPKRLTRVRLAAHNKRHPDPQSFYVGIDKMLAHPKYVLNGIDADYDIGMIKLTKKVTLSEKVRTLCLPSPEDTFEDHDCFLAGWGTTSSDGRDKKGLQQLKFPIIKNENCPGGKWPYQPWYICAGHLEAGIGVCYGDSGGPLQCRKADGRWYLAGVTSWAVNETCAIAGYPDVFARATFMLDWINDMIAAG